MPWVRPEQPVRRAVRPTVLAAALGVAACRLGAQGDALWLPVVLHWGWEADEGWEDLKRLAEAAAPYAAPWQDFLDTVERTKDTP